MDDTAFRARLAETAAAVERELDGLLVVRTEAGEIARPRRLIEAMRYATLGGGKRLEAVSRHRDRPRARPTPTPAPVRAGAAIECVHAYSLIHDDLPAMDDDDLRRGRPTAHRAFDEATAILAGDALQTLAFEILADPSDRSQTPRSAPRSAPGLARAAGLAGMVGGQMLDIEAETAAAPHSTAEIARLQAMKTGALLRFSVEAGALLAGASAIGARGAVALRPRRSARRFRSPTTCSTPRATRRRSASAPARTPAATRRRWSPRSGSTARARELAALVGEAKAAVDAARPRRSGRRAAGGRRIRRDAKELTVPISRARRSRPEWASTVTGAGASSSAPTM